MINNLENILKKKLSCKSVWFMRQAGRYLPEFQEIRAKNKNFIDLCFNSKLSSEITLQPIKRFNLDSAIIFSDILLVPYALGQKVSFIKNLGPELTKLNINKFLQISESNFYKVLKPVYKAIEITRKKLETEKSLICFVGAPWTLLVYMLDLKKGKKEIDASKIESSDVKIDVILDKLTKFLCLHIKNQIDAGANVVQIFDSWAGFIPEKKINEYCFAPNKKIVEFCKKEKIPSICFPKGLRKKYLEFNNIVQPDGINIDYEIEPLWAKENLKNVVIQGGLHPEALLKTEEEMFKEATKYIQAFKDTPYVFNLGHGLLPETDPDRVEKLIKFYRNF